MRQAAIAASADDTLPALMCVRMEIDGDSITLAATDRYRLAVSQLTWTPARQGLSGAVLVPARAMSDTARAMTSAAEVSIALTDDAADAGGMIGFEAGGLRSTVRLGAGDFPFTRACCPSPPMPSPRCR